MADVIAAFFDNLNQRDHEPQLQKADGTIRFDLEHEEETEHWHVEIRRGKVQAERTPQPREADCVLRTTRSWFQKFATGEEHGLAGLLRADAIAEGNLRLMFHFQRVAPGPPGARDPRDLYTSAWERDRDA
jgi:SCP-2 sterol transfer family